MSFTSLKPFIKSKLEGIDSIEEVQAYHASEFTGFPAVTFESDSINKNDMQTTGENFRSLQFSLIIWQELEQTGRENATNYVDAVVDDIMAAFDTDFTLGGECLRITPIIGAKENEDSSGGKTIRFNIILSCENLDSITS